MTLFKFCDYQDGSCPETSMKIGGDLLNTDTWSELIQVLLLKLSSFIILCPKYTILNVFPNLFNS